MIRAVLVDGVQVNNEYTFLSGVRDSAAAQTDLQSYSRGGRSGVALGNPFYRGFVLSLEWTVIGRTPEQLLQQRDRLARFFRLKPDKTVSQTKTLGFVMADNSVREVPVIFSPYTGSIQAQDTTKTTIQVTAQTEVEYFVSTEEFINTASPLSLGGFSVPFDVPLNMGNSPSGEPTIINNLGNSEYYPVITFEGPLETITLINDTTGKELGYAGELLDGDSLVVDCYDRTAMLNGTTNALADMSGLNQGQGWYLDSGNNVIRLVVGSGTGSAEIRWKHAYRGI